MNQNRWFLLLAGCLILSCRAATEVPAQWDALKYIRPGEVKPDMDAYCLTVMRGSKVEKYPLKVLSVVEGSRPGRSMILVVGTDELFRHVGSVHGCSGSPVYIDGRMAGALAAGWDGSIDPLYLVTPIEDMLTIGETYDKNRTGNAVKTSYVEAGAPLDLEEVARKAQAAFSQSPLASHQLPMVTNFSAAAFREVSGMLSSGGLVPLQAGEMTQGSGETPSKTVFEPGGVLTVPLCSGDVKMAVTGTVTEVVGDKVYGFGHAFNGIGAVELPMAAGIIHTVVATRQTSMKIGTPSSVGGTLRFDQETGVVGYIGQIPKTIDLTVHVTRFDDPRKQVLRCNIARDRSLTPSIVQAAITAAALFQGDLPQEHTLSYHCNMVLENGQVFDFKGLSSGQSVTGVSRELMSLTASLMNNAFQQMLPDKVKLDIHISPENLISSLWEIRVSDTTVKPGETVNVYVVLKGFRSEPKTYRLDLMIPRDCPNGKFQLQVMGAEAYRQFLTKTTPQRLTVVDAYSLVEGLKKVLSIDDDRIYLCLPLTQSGLAIRNAELPNLPTSKMMLIADTRRLEPITPYTNLVENSLQTGRIISGAAAIDITVDSNE